MTRSPRYGDPFYWWGPGWETPAGRTIADLLRDGTIDPGTASVLWAALARRRSVVVVAGPSGVGKSTLLGALLEFLPHQTRRLYLRGCFESFSFLSDESIVATNSALLVNEISPHLPVYLWGPAVARVIDAAERGFSLLATAHATSIAEFVGAFTGSPLRIPAARLGAFEFVVFMAYCDQTPSGRRVHRITRLHGTGGGVAFETLPRLHYISQETTPPIPSHNITWFPDEELVERARILDDLTCGRIDVLPFIGRGR